LSFKTLVLGIGNNLLTDEGVGIHVIRYLQTHHADIPDVEYMDGGTLSFTLAEPIASVDGLIVVDATRLDGPPGTMGVFENAEMDVFLKGKRSNVHEVSLTDLMDMTRLTDDLPKQRCLVGIQPGVMDWGETPTSEVAAMIPTAAERVLAKIAQWRAGDA
jgi:hydrogenase maturation protease